MIVRPGSRRVALRLALLLGSTAAATLPTAPAAAQTAPNPLATPVLAAGGGGGAAISIDAAAGQAKIDVAGSNRLVQWDSFNVGANAAVAFSDSSASAGHLAVLNTVNAAGGLSQIYGRITADPKISVWLANPSGIVFGGSGGFSGGSLVLTTAQIGAADRARFDRTAPDSLTGTIQLAGMTADATKGVTLGPQTGLAVTGGVVIAGQVVKVLGTITASGDVALVAAETATVPLDLASPIAVTINRGATVGSATLGAGGAITAANITLGAAAASGYDMLLSVDSGAALTATAASGGRVVIAAGRTSGETGASGTPAVTLAPIANADTGGTARLTSAGALTATGRAWLGASGDLTAGAGSVTTLEGSANALTLDAFGNLTVAADLTAAHGAVALTAGFAGSLSGRIVSGSAAGDPGGIAISAYSGLTLGRADGVAQVIQSTGNVALRTSMGLITAPGATRIVAGNLGGSAADIAIRQGVTADLALGGATLVAGADANGAADHVGTVTLQTSGVTIQPTGNVTVGSIDAGTLVLPLGGGSQLTGTFTADQVVTQGPLAIRSTAGSLRIGQATSLTGGVSLVSDTGDISGTAIAPAGDGRPLDGYGRTSITAVVAGSGVAATAGGTAQLGTIAAGGAIGVSATTLDVTSVNSGADLSLAATGGQLSLGTGVAQGGAALTKTGTTGELSVGGLDAGTDASLTSATSVRADTVTARRGDLTIDAPGQVTGRTASSPAAVADGVRVASVGSAGAIAIDAAGNVRLGVATSDGGAIGVAANGSVTGLATGDVSSNTGAALSAGGAIRVGASTQRPTRVALGAVSAGTTLALVGDGVSAAGLDAGGAVMVQAGSGLSLDQVGAVARPAGVTLAQTPATAGTGQGGEDPSVVTMTSGTVLSPGYAAANLSTRGGVSVRAGRDTPAPGSAGIAQLGIVTGGSVSVAANALAVGTASAVTGALSLTARTGGLYAGLLSAATTATLVKTGATGDAATDARRNEVRLTDRLAAGSDVSVTSATGVRGTQIASAAGSIAVTAATGSVSGLVASAAPADGRLLAGYDRLSLAAGAPTATIGVTAAQTAQLGTVTAGVTGSGISAMLNQVIVRATAIDVTTLRASNGNAALIAEAGGLRLGSGDAGASFALYNPYDRTYAPGLDSATDAQIGSARAATGDLLLRIPGRLTGLLAPGVSFAAAADGLAIGTLTGTGDVSVSGAGDVRLDGVSAGGAASINAGGSVRLGDLVAGGAIGVTATLSVTGSPFAPLPTNTGATLTADVGAIRLPSTGAPGAVAVLGAVTAGSDVSLAAARLSTGAVTAGGTATLAGGAGLSVASVSGASVAASSSTAGTIATDSGATTLDGAGFLRAGFGGANLRTRSAVAPVTVTARGGAAQLGTVAAAAGPLVGQQVRIAGQAVLVSALTAPAASLAVTAASGDLALGAGGAAVGDSATLLKTGTAGAIRLTGALTTGVGGLPATVVAGGDTAPGSGGVLATSSTDLLATAIVSRTGDVRLRATGRVGGLAGDGVTGDGVRLGTATATTAAVASGGDLRIGELTTTGDQMLTATGSITGLAGATVAASLDVTAANLVDVRGAGGGTLGQATLRTLAAGTTATVVADRIAVQSLTAGGAATLTAGAGLSVGALRSGAATLQATAATTTGSVLDYAADDTSVANEPLATAAGAATLTSRSGGVSVVAGRVAQLGAVSAGGMLAGGTRDSLDVNARALTIASATAAGPMTLTATAGGLYLGTGITTGTATLVKQGTTSSALDATANELRVGSLTGAGDFAIMSATGLRLGQATSSAGSVALTATGGDITGLLRAASVTVPADGQMLPAYDGAIAIATGAPAATQRIAVSASGLVKLDTVMASDRITVSGTAIDVVTARATGGSLALTSTTGRVRLGAGTAGGDATLTAGAQAVTNAAVVADAQIGSLTAGGNLGVFATGSVSGLLATGQAAPLAGEGLRIASLSGASATISAASDARLGTIGVTGALSLSAGRDATGLSTADNGTAVPASTVANLTAGGSVTVGRPIGAMMATQAQRLAAAALGTVSAGTVVSVDAATLLAGAVTGGGVSLTAARALSVDSVTTPGAVALSTDTVASGRASSTLFAADATLASGYRQSGAFAGTLTAGTLIATVAGVAQLAQLTTAGGDLTVNAAAMSLGTLKSAGALSLTATGGGLYVDSGTATGSATLLKTIARGDAAVDAAQNVIRAGTLAAGPSASVTSDTAIRIDAATVAGRNAPGAGVDLTLVARGGDVSGRATSTGYGRADLKTTGTGAGIGVSATGGALLGAVAAGRDVTVTATAIDATRTTATTGALSLTASGGQLTLGTGSAGVAATLTKTGTVGEIGVGTLTAGTSASLVSDTAVRVDQATARDRTTIANTPDLLVLAKAGDVSGRAGGRAGLTASAAQASIGVSASGTATLGTVTAGNTVTVSATAIDATTTTATAGALSLTASGGQLTLGAGSAGVAATLTKTGTVGEMGVGTLTAGTSASLVSDTSVRIDQATVNGRVDAGATNPDLFVNAKGGDVSGRAGGRAGLADTAGGASVGVTATGSATLGTVVAANSVTVAATAIDATTTTATAGALSLTASGGHLTLGTGSAGAAAMLTKTGASGGIGIGGVTGASVTATSDTSLSATSATAGAGDVVLTAKAGALSLGTGTANGALTLTAMGGALTLGTGTSGLAATLTKTGTAGELGVGTLTAGTSASLVSDTAVRVDQATARGRTTIANTPDLLVLAKGGDVSGRAGGRAGLADTAAGASVGMMAKGLATLGTVAAANTVTVGATAIDATTTTATTGALSLTATGGALTLGTGSAGAAATLTKTGTSGGVGIGGVAGASVTATSDTSLSASSATASKGDVVLTAKAGALSLGTGTASGALTLTATTDALTLGSGTAGTSATLTKAGTAGKMAIAGTLSAPGQITLATSTDLDLGGLVSSTSASILVDQTAGKGIGLGFTSTAAPLDFNLTPTEVAFVAAPSVIFQAHGGDLQIGSVALDRTGTDSLYLLSTGAITVRGTVAGLGDIAPDGVGVTPRAGGSTSRVLQLGGSITTDNIVPLAASLTGTLETGASITWSGSVDLRARQILFGDAALRGAVGGQGGAAVATSLVSKPSSPLYYTGGGGGRTFLTANQLTVRYGDYALFQNTGATSAINAGLKLGPDGNSTNTIALVLDGPGDNGANAFALFGTINGFVGRSAGLLPDTVIDFASRTTPRVLRITQSNSRVNGCVIGSPDRGCLNIDTPPPTLKLFDERYLLLFDTNQDAEVSFDPLVATNNEALLGELVTGPEHATPTDCPTGSADPRCAASARKE